MVSEWIDDEVIACVFDYADDVKKAAKICEISVEMAKKILNEYAEPYEWGEDNE